MLKNTEKTMEKIVALCKGRGFVYPGSEIYGGLANTWDYGPLGVELKNNIKKAWLKRKLYVAVHFVLHCSGKSDSYLELFALTENKCSQVVLICDECGRMVVVTHIIFIAAGSKDQQRS